MAFDIDYRSKVSRAEFEGACKDLKIKFTKPIFDALANSGLTLVCLSHRDLGIMLTRPQDNITSVILTGGASRTPMIQTAVRAAVGECVCRSCD